MSTCQTCTRTTELHLCTPCVGILGELLAELPWLLHQLDVTLCRRDRLNTGGGLHTHTDNANPLNVGAMELARDISRTLHQIALDVAEVHASERIPALVNASPSLVAWWLRGNLSAIQNHPKAGEHYRAIVTLVGDTHPGAIHQVINRPATRFAGPCPGVHGYNRDDGSPIRCGTTLWAYEDDMYTTCPRCQTIAHVADNIRRARKINDLIPEEAILEALEYNGTPTTRAALIGWIATKKLRPHAWLTRKGRAKRPTRSTDPPLYSFHTALRLQQKQTTRV